MWLSFEDSLDGPDQAWQKRNRSIGRTRRSENDNESLAWDVIAMAIKSGGL